ncbi:MAG: hypothetical protein J0M08_12290 [Bacteroidetes bacterium]|nr:hypothetical protein [Bacteroidota bacterium]
MNHSLYSKIKDLDSKELNQCKLDFANAHFILKTIEYVISCNEPHFRTQQIVSYLYSSELKKTPIITLQNRYYKIRKRLLEYFNAKRKLQQTILTSEETRFYELTRTTKYNANEVDYENKLDALEKDLWDNNVFELLPLLLEHRLSREFERGMKFHSLLKKYKKAKLLQEDISQVKELRFVMAELNFKYGEKAIIEYLNKVEYLAQKNSEYLRFKFLYNYLCVYNKRKWDKLSDVKVLKKHLSVCKSIVAKYPRIPLFDYTIDYEKDTAIKIIGTEAAVLYFNYEYDKAEIALLSKIKLSQKYKFTEKSSLLRDIQNRAVTLIYCKKYSEAWQLLTETIPTSRTSDETSVQINYFYRALAIAHSYPKTPILQYDYLINYLKKLVTNNATKIATKLIVPYKVALSKLLVIKKDFKAAHRLISDSTVKAYLHEIVDYQLILDFYKLLLIHDSFKNKEYILRLKKKLYNEKNPQLMMEYEWYLKMGNRLLE